MKNENYSPHIYSMLFFLKYSKLFKKTKYKL